MVLTKVGTVTNPKMLAICSCSHNNDTVLYIASRLDTILVVNGPNAIQHPNVKTINRDDYGTVVDAWFAGFSSRDKDYDSYLFLDANLSGPSFPIWFDGSIADLKDVAKMLYNCHGFLILQSDAAKIASDTGFFKHGQLELLASEVAKIGEVCRLAGEHPLDSIFHPSPIQIPIDFDWRMYLYLHQSARDDISEQGAKNHWLTHRYPYKALRSFDDLFNWHTYLDKYSDLRNAGIDDPHSALLHFFRYGIEEGRTGI